MVGFFLFYVSRCGDTRSLHVRLFVEQFLLGMGGIQELLSVADLVEGWRVVWRSEWIMVAWI